MSAELSSHALNCLRQSLRLSPRAMPDKLHRQTVYEPACLLLSCNLPWPFRLPPYFRTLVSLLSDPPTSGGVWVGWVGSSVDNNRALQACLVSRGVPTSFDRCWADHGADHCTTDMRLPCVTELPGSSADGCRNSDPVLWCCHLQQIGPDRAPC
jgi:hypothetical protein